MAVGNHVVGDSRVIKAALSAREAGYDVTVLGIKHRSVPTHSFIEREIPILRVPVEMDRHAEAMMNFRANASEKSAPDTRLSKVSDVFLRAFNRQKSKSPSARRSLYRNAYRAVHFADLALEQIANGKQWLASAPSNLANAMPESWKRIWPQIEDYERAFYSGFEFLKPDIIHVHDRHPMAGAELYCFLQQQRGNEVKWVYDAHEWLPGQSFSPPEQHRKGWLRAESELIGGAAAVITVSDLMAEELAKRHNLTSRPFVVCNMPRKTLSHQHGSNKSVRADCKLPPTTPLAVYIGAIAERRGIFTLIHAIKYLPEFHVALVVSNSPKQRALIRELAVETGVDDRVHILDYVDPSEVSEYISTADVGVSPLLDTEAHHKAVPTKVFEYIHAQLPVVVSDMTSQAKLVEKNKIGHVFENGSAIGLARALNETYNDPTLKQKLNTAIIEAHSWENQQDELYAAWHRAENKNFRVNSVSEQMISKATSFTVATSLSPTSRYTSLISRKAPLIQYTAQIHPTLTKLEDLRNHTGTWTLIKQHLNRTDAFVYDLEALSLRNLPSTEAFFALLSHLNIPVIQAVHNIGAVDCQLMMELFPDHWLHEMSPDYIRKRSRQARRYRERILRHEGHIVADDQSIVSSLSTSAIYFPPVHLSEHTPNTQATSKVLRVGVINMPRSSKEKLALKTVSGFPSLTVGRIDNTDDISRFDLVVDSLVVDTPSAIGAQAMADGTPIVAGSQSTSSTFRGAADFRTVLRTSPSGFAELVNSMSVNALVQLGDLQRQEFISKLQQQLQDSAIGGIFEV